MTSEMKIPEIKISYKTGKTKTIKISSSKDAHSVIREFFNKSTIELTEEFLILLLDNSHKGIGWYRVSTGGVSGTLVDPRLVFSVCLKAGASALICAHNHPSGNLNTSRQDIEISRKLSKGASLLQIDFLDHLILAGDSMEYTSLADEGMLSF